MRMLSFVRNVFYYLKRTNKKNKLKDEVSFREELLLVSKYFPCLVEVESFAYDFSHPKSWLKSALLKLLLQRTYKSVRHPVTGI